MCRGCDQTICRSRHCSDWDRTTGYWECVACIKNRDSQVRAGEWILDQLNRRFKGPKSDVSRDDTVSYKDAETRKSRVFPIPKLFWPFYLSESERSFNGSTYSISIEQKEKVRQFLEEIIADIIGGPLDEVPVTKLHSHPDCKSIWGSFTWKLYILWRPFFRYQFQI